MELRDALLSLALLIAAVGGGTVAVGATPLLDEDPAFEETDIRSVDTSDPHCVADHDHDTGVERRQTDRGRVLRVADTVPVDSRTTAVDVTLAKFGPNRYVLRVDRTPGIVGANCDLHVRYGVALNVSDPDAFTLVVTHDDRLVGTYYGGASESGGSATADGPGS